MTAAATAAGRVCWVDADWDRSQASDGVSRYGAYLRGHAELFHPGTAGTPPTASPATRASSPSPRFGWRPGRS
jgi:hypothetical protein